jgi:hypothetical protein
MRQSDPILTAVRQAVYREIDHKLVEDFYTSLAAGFFVGGVLTYFILIFISVFSFISVSGFVGWLVFILTNIIVFCLWERLSIQVYCWSISSCLWENLSREISLERGLILQRLYDAHQVDFSGVARHHVWRCPQTGLKLAGPPEFISTVQKIMKQLRELAPHRYREVQEFLPQAVYDPESITPHLGRSDGIFGVKDFGSLRNILLHEVGHNVCMRRHEDSSEEGANRYSRMVISELGG